MSIACVPTRAMRVTFPRSITRLRRCSTVIVDSVNDGAFLLRGSAFCRLHVGPGTLRLVGRCIGGNNKLLVVNNCLSFVKVRTGTGCGGAILTSILPIAVLSNSSHIRGPRNIVTRPSRPRRPIVGKFSRCPFFLNCGQTVTGRGTRIMLAVGGTPLLIFNGCRGKGVTYFVDSYSPR